MKIIDANGLDTKMKGPGSGFRGVGDIKGSFIPPSTSSH